MTKGCFFNFLKCKRCITFPFINMHAYIKLHYTMTCDLSSCRDPSMEADYLQAIYEAAKVEESDVLVQNMAALKYT